MDNKTPTEIDQLDSSLPPTLQFENAADAIGICFAAAVLFAVLAAGTIIYRSNSSDIVTASNAPLPAAAHNDPLSPPILPEQ